MNLFGHIFRTPDDKLLKQMVFGTVEWSKRRRPRRRWKGDAEEWCNNDLHSFSNMASDRTEWRQMSKHALDTSEH